MTSGWKCVGLLYKGTMLGVVRYDAISPQQPGVAVLALFHRMSIAKLL